MMHFLGNVRIPWSCHDEAAKKIVLEFEEEQEACREAMAAREEGSSPNTCIDCTASVVCDGQREMASALKGVKTGRAMAARGVASIKMLKSIDASPLRLSAAKKLIAEGRWLASVLSGSIAISKGQVIDGRSAAARGVAWINNLNATDLGKADLAVGKKLIAEGRWLASVLGESIVLSRAEITAGRSAASRGVAWIDKLNITDLSTADLVMAKKLIAEGRWLTSVLGESTALSRAEITAGRSAAAQGVAWIDKLNATDLSTADLVVAKKLIAEGRWLASVLG